MIRLVRPLAAAALIATSSIALADTVSVSLVGSVPAGSPSVYTVQTTFALPTGFTNASISFTNLYADDRGILSLNGSTLTSFGLLNNGSPGSMTFAPGGANTAYSFLLQSGPNNATFNGPFQAGTNTLALLINDTNTGIFGAPLASTNISSWDVRGTVTYTVNAVAPVPEPSTYALLGLGLVLLGAMARRRRA